MTPLALMLVVAWPAAVAAAFLTRTRPVRRALLHDLGPPAGQRAAGPDGSGSDAGGPGHGPTPDPTERPAGTTTGAAAPGGNPARPATGHHGSAGTGPVMSDRSPTAATGGGEAAPTRRGPAKGPGHRDVTGWARPASEGTATGPLTALGRAIRRAVRRPGDPSADRRVGLAVLLAALLAPFGPVLALVPLGWAAASPAVAARRAVRAHEAAVVDQLPDVVDLLTLTIDAGLPVGAALSAIAGRPGGPLGAAVARAAGHLSQGGTTAGALTAIADAAPTVRPLVDSLAEHDRYGTPLRPALVRAGIEARLRRRRQAEEAARRLPVTLLFPLVLTTLPAFFLLAIVPLLAGSLGSLSP